MEIFETKEFKKLLSKNPQQALSIVYENFHREARGICHKKLRDAEQAEEAYSHGWERLVVRFQPGKPKFRGESKFSTYLYQVFFMSCAQLIRSKRFAKNKATLELLEARHIASEKTPETEILRLSIDEDLCAMINYALTDFDRKVLKLRVDKDMTIAECAKTLNVSKGKIKTRARRLGIKIKNYTEKEARKKTIVIDFKKAYLKKKKSRRRSNNARSQKSDTERMLGNY